MNITSKVCSKKSLNNFELIILCVFYFFVQKQLFKKKQMFYSTRFIYVDLTSFLMNLDTIVKQNVFK